MKELNEAKKRLDASLGDDLRRKYFALLKRWFQLTSTLTKLEFDIVVRSLLVTEEQMKNHNGFLLALYAKINNTRTKTVRTSSSKGCFEIADYMEYIPSFNPKLPKDVQYRSASAELFLPDNAFIDIRIAIHAWENGLEGAEDGVADIVMQVCQNFLRNIITAMVSRKSGYKIRDGKFQYGFGMFIPDPFIRNTNNVIDDTQQCKVDVSNDDDSFIPVIRPSLEIVEQQTAFEYSCAKKKHSNNVLSKELLYDTIRENPNVLEYYSVYSINSIRTGLSLEDSTP